MFYILFYIICILKNNLLLIESFILKMLRFFIFIYNENNFKYNFILIKI